MPRNERHLRHVAASTLQWYLEFEDGILASQFDSRLLNYRIDVERIFEALTEGEQELLLSVHRDGLEPVDAAALTGWLTNEPERLVSTTELKFATALVKQNMNDLLAYLRA